MRLFPYLLCIFQIGASIPHKLPSLKRLLDGKKVKDCKGGEEAYARRVAACIKILELRKIELDKVTQEFYRTYNPSSDFGLSFSNYILKLLDSVYFAGYLQSDQDSTPGLIQLYQVMVVKGLSLKKARKITDISSIDEVKKFCEVNDVICEEKFLNNVQAKNIFDHLTPGTWSKPIEDGKYLRIYLLVNDSVEDNRILECKNASKALLAKHMNFALKTV